MLAQEIEEVRGVLVLEACRGSEGCYHEYTRLDVEDPLEYHCLVKQLATLSTLLR